MRSLHEIRPINVINSPSFYRTYLRRIRAAELCVIEASILTAGTDMNASNSLLSQATQA